MQPTLPEKIPEEDARIEIDFEEIYDLIYSMEKEMKGERVESPPWDRKYNKGGIKEMTGGIKMSLKVNSILSSAEVYPQEAEEDVRKLIKTFMKKAMRGGEEESFRTNDEKLENKELSGFDDSSVTGKTIFSV